ncbi:hypothetical protein NLU13_7500 [Sarocladium strictum]|uniref:MARVEL domain-containing protein n=1 Tax=Sarocladium strictum TaxID=5046 RepID=A0AA39L5M3_SARSR|nr:hypothetical protein NLU13_7500 [Sarocladium strictum]
MALERIVSMVLRAAQLVFAAIVAGVNGEYLHKSNASSWALGRQIYTEVVAGLAIFLALLRLFPFASHFFSWPVDIFMSILWWVAFGLLVDLVGTQVCGGLWDWSNIAPRGDACGKLKAVIAFAFLSAVLWLASAIVGFFWVRRQDRHATKVDAHHHRRHGRRGWGRSRV